MRVIKPTFVLGGAAALAVGMSGVASAATGIVTVTHNNGGVQVGTALPGQPLLGVSADNSGICVGFSYETGTCVPVTVN